MKHAIMSNAKDPDNRSKKLCACGGHSHKARKRRRPWGKLRKSLEKRRSA